MKFGVISLIFFVVVFTEHISAQEDSLFAYLNEKDRINTFGGLKAYYFWEEDSNGLILNSSFKKAYKLNQAILIDPKNRQRPCTDSMYIQAVTLFSQDNSSRLARSRFKIQELGKRKKTHLPLIRSYSSETENIAYVRSKGSWESKVFKNVLYLRVNADSSCKFVRSGDSISLQLNPLHIRVFGHYIVKQFYNQENQLVSEHVITFDGRDISELVSNETKPVPRHLLVFSGGYRGRKFNKDVTDNLVTTKDRFHYWLRLDKAFIRKIKPDDYFYIDGNHSISTSNHRTMSNFSLSYSRIKSVRKKEKNRHKYTLLNTKPNDEGFALRKESGKLAGQSFLAINCNFINCIEVKDTIDLICHSMGYAYALGFAETIKDYVVFRNFYIIAPENACADSTNWAMFQEVWQYGTHLEGDDAEPIWQQDGIAPQCAVKGISEITNGGRVYFPKDTKHLNFINSHMLNHYRWIFNQLKEGDKGFVKP